MVGTRAEQATNRKLWVVISLVALLAIVVVAYLTLRGGGSETSYSPPAGNAQDDAANVPAALSPAKATAVQAQAPGQAAADNAAAAQAQAAAAPAETATNSVASVDASDTPSTRVAAPVNSFTDDYADQTGDTRAAAPQAGAGRSSTENSTGEP